MKISYQWLHDYCDFDFPPEELADLLSMRGMEVDSMAPVGDDTCIDIEVTANRPDLLSHIGIAREISSLTGNPLRIPEAQPSEEARKVAEFARVEVYNPELCPRYTARVLYDVQVGPAPAQMQRRLETVGLRPVNNIVDITNYVLLECGQPEHAFDLARLRGNVVIVRPATAGEVIALIDGTEVKLAPEHLVIADAVRPVALAGIMGGFETEISANTTVVLLESARFDPVNIRRSTRTTGKTSDSSYRFERGVDVPTVEWASRRAAALMQQHAGARLAAGVVDANFTKAGKRTVRLRVPRIEHVLGMGIDGAQAGKLLESIGFGVEARDDALEVTVPSFRPDVALEIDLIEEVARCHGYGKVPNATRLPIMAVTDTKFDKVAVLARHTLLRLGYHEAVTTSFLAEELAQAFSPWDGEEPVRLSNPLRSDEASLRRSLVPSLLQAKRLNQDRGTPEVRLFELDRVYLRRPAGQRLPREKTCLAALADAGFQHLKGAGEAVFQQLGMAERVSLVAADYSFLTPGVAAVWRVGLRPVGYVGEVSEEAAALFDLRGRPCVVEIDLEPLVAEAVLERTFRDLPRFPAIARDLAIVVKQDVTWEAILGIVKGAGAEHLESVDFGEVYCGKQVERGRKSVFFSLVFRAPGRTLTHDEANASQARIVDALAQELRATLRA